MKDVRGRYEMLMACYLSGQMSQAQFEEHKTHDAVFSAWVSRRMTREGDGG